MTRKKNIFKVWYSKALIFWNYCVRGVWQDSRRNWRVKIIRVLNLSVKSFLNADLQSMACAMTYRTLLAIVPAMALLFAIGRGFGLQTMLEEELFKLLPSQHQSVSYAMNFVDAYLSTSSEGVFVGIGLVVLLWTLISLFGSIEDSFNLIWGVKQGRSLGRKITDYTAMLLILPVLMICAGGLSVVVSSTLQSLLHWDFMSPLVSWSLEGTSWVLTWLFFGLLYLLMPNTKVKVFNALIAGVFAGTGFLILQWLFVSGQLYVSRYNAIYGSFSFLPLLLLWMQFTWLITFAGGVLCFSSQNIFSYNFYDAIDNMSEKYRIRLNLAVCAVVVQRFVAGEGATDVGHLARKYDLPPRLITMLCDKLVSAGILSVAIVDASHDIKGYQPAIDPADITVAKVHESLESIGSNDFIPSFDRNFPGVITACDRITDAVKDVTADMKVSELKINRIHERITKYHH